MGKKIVQTTYKIVNGMLDQRKLNKTDMKRMRYFLSPADAIVDKMGIYDYHYRNESGIAEMGGNGAYIAQSKADRFKKMYEFLFYALNEYEDTKQLEEVQIIPPELLI